MKTIISRIRIFCVLMLLTLMVPGSARAAVIADHTFPMGDSIIGTYNENHTVLTVSGSGATYAGYDGYSCATHYRIDPKVEELVFEGNITTISEYTFAYTNIRSVVIPDTVKEIKEGAFDCCTELKTVDLGNSVEIIGENAFDGGTGSYGVEELTLSPALKEAGRQSGWDSLKKLNVGEFHSDEDLAAFLNLYQNSLTTITVAEDNSFYCMEDGILFSGDLSELVLYTGGADLSNYQIPESVIRVADYAFADADNLEEISLPENLQEIGCNAFAGCDSLKMVRLPGNLKNIGEDAFAYCQSLDEIDLGICEADAAWGQVFNHQYPAVQAEITVSSDNRAYTIKNGVLFNKDRSCLEWYPSGKDGTVYKVPSTVVEIADYAFCQTGKLEYVALDRKLETIGNYAFEGSGVNSVKMKENLRSIGEQAFEASDLKELKLGTGVVSIGKQAFAYCSSLKNVMLNSALKKIGMDAFDNSGVASMAVGLCEANVAQAFGLNNKLAEITVSSGNKAYIVKDNVLYNRAMTKLMFYPGGKKGESYTVPKTVKYLGQYAITGKKLRKLIFSGNLKSVGRYAVADSRIDTIILNSNTTVPTFDSKWNGEVQDVYYSTEDEDIPARRFYVKNRTLAKKLKANLRSAGTWNILYSIYVGNKMLCKGTGGEIVLY